MRLITISICVALAVLAVILARGQMNDTQTGHDHVHTNSVSRVDCDPFGCISEGYLAYSYTDNNGQYVYSQHVCDGDPDGKVVKQDTLKANGVHSTVKDPDGAGGKCGWDYMHVGNEPAKHHAYLVDPGTGLVIARDNWSCHNPSTPYC